MSSEAAAEVLRDQFDNQPTETSQSLPCAGSHVLSQPCGSFRCHSGDAEQDKQGEDADGSEHGRTSEFYHQVWHSKGRTYVQGGGRDRSKVLSVVPSSVGSQRQKRAPRVPVLSEHVDGTQGNREWDQWIKDWRPTANEASAESRWQGSWSSSTGMPIDLEIDEEPWDQVSLAESLMPPKMMSRIDQLENVLMQVVSQLQSLTPPAAAAQSD